MKAPGSLVTACIAIFALSSVAFALPQGKTGAQLPALTKTSQFEELKGGGKVVLVCKMCDTVRCSKSGTRRRLGSLQTGQTSLPVTSLPLSPEQIFSLANGRCNQENVAPANPADC
jgi:hypothetical protein